MNGVRIALDFVSELERLACPGIVDFNVGAFAPATSRVNQLRGAGPALLCQISDPELPGTRLE